MTRSTPSRPFKLFLRAKWPITTKSRFPLKNSADHGSCPEEFGSPLSADENTSSRTPPVRSRRDYDNEPSFGRLLSKISGNSFPLPEQRDEFRSAMFCKFCNFKFYDIFVVLCGFSFRMTGPLVTYFTILFINRDTILKNPEEQQSQASSARENHFFLINFE